MSNTKLEEIISKIAEQGNKPDFSFLKDNPEAQAKLLIALLCSNKAKSDLKECKGQISCSVAAASSSENDVDNSKKLDSSIEKMCLIKKSGRKPISEDEESDSTQRRKAQNRAAQKAFRERKENRTTELHLENKKLRETIIKLHSENAALLSSFAQPLSTNQDFEDERPQKIVRGCPLVPCLEAVYCNQSKSSTAIIPEINNPNDFLNFDPPLPSNILLDHSELLGNIGSLNDFCTANPKQFDLFNPLKEEYNNKFEIDEFGMDNLCAEVKKKANCRDPLEKYEQDLSIPKKK
ncbi:unnamed protein product [Rhizopus stolonifer]